MTTHAFEIALQPAALEDQCGGFKFGEVHKTGFP
jgi:hypothetical protein